jgi:post-segregation antitoxin (ccd killing protein)
MVRSAVASRGAVETDAEVPADTRRIDLWFMPDPACEPVPGYLGLLGRITAGPSTLEFFHNTPSGDALADCVIKHGQFRHYLSLRKPPPPIPTQWVISSGRPKGGIEGLRLHPLEGWPPGIYEGPPLFWTRLVVVSELPVTPDTLLLRLLGAGQVLKQAIAELKALRTEDPARSLALPLLVRLRLEIPTDPAQRTDDDQEFLMQTQDIVETWRQEAIQEGLLVAQVKALLTVLRARGIAVPDAAQRRIQAERDLARLERWLERASVASSVAEVIDDAS